MNPYNTDSPRTAFSKQAESREQASMKLMTALDATRVERVKRAFELRNDSVCLYDFLNIMEANLPSQLYVDTGRQELITNLVDMFKEVDINGDGSMEWEEFTRFMVEKAALYKESQNVDRIPNYFHNQQLESCGFRHRGSIDCLTVLPRYKQFACIENGSPVISLYSARSGNLVTSMQCKAVPLSVCYVEPLQALIASCSDTTMVRFNVGESHHKVRYKQRSVWSTPDTQMTMCWQPTHNLLYSGSVGGRVHAWDVETQEQRCCLEGHTDIVMQVLSIDSLDSIVSGSLDRTINIWDSYTEQQTTKLLGHTKGVNSLAFNSTHRFLISSGFDHDCFVWSPFGSTLLHKLRGHRAALVGCHTVDGTSELLTADTSGIFKLWDLRNFQCLQTFTSEHEPGDLDDLSGTLSCFSHAKFPNPVASLGVSGERIDDYRIIAASKKIVFFDQERVRQDPVTDGPIRVACFNTQSLTIFTASERNVKIWDAILGSVKYSYKNITVADITAACLDDRQRKFILGQSTGCVTVYNYQNGTVMKQFAPQADSPVIKLIYSANTKTVIAGYMDGIIRVYDENDIESCRIVRSFDEAYIHRGDLNTIAHLSSLSMVASGGNLPSDGIRLWDYDSGKCETVISTHNYEVLSLKFLENYPLLAASTSDSMIRIFGIPPNVAGSNLFVEFANELPEGTLLSSTNEAILPVFDEKESLEQSQVNWDAAEVTRFEEANQFLKANASADETNNGNFTLSKKSKSPASSMAWDPMDECLYTGDEAGHLRKWDLRRMLKHLGLKKIISGSSPMRSLHNIGTRTSSQDHFEQLCSPAGMALSSSLVEFRWGKELAHEADITTVEMISDPKAVLTTSTDCCVKMFACGGTKIGRLVQSVKTGHRSACWNFPMDVERRVASETVEITAIMESAAKTERENEAKLRSERYRLKTETKSRRKRSSKGKADAKGLSSDPENREQMHKKVLSVLANVKTHSVQGDTDSVSSGVSIVGNPKFRDKSRRLPPSLKLTDPTSRPPIVLSGLGPGLDQISRSGGSSTHLPQISVSNSHVQLGKDADVGDNILASMARLNAQLDILED